MDVLMLGWEFPPYFAGGVGVVCQALAKAFVRRGNRVTFVMPHGPDRERTPAATSSGSVEVVSAAAAATRLRLEPIQSLLRSYAGAGDRRLGPLLDARKPASSSEQAALYGPNLLEEVERFAERCLGLVRNETIPCSVIHAHDWTTFRAGIELRKATGRPLVAHVHITEFDKSGGMHADPRIYALEKEGMEAADAVVTVSGRIRDACIERYGIEPRKVHVVYNALEPLGNGSRRDRDGAPMVLFLGRVTLQKGPDYFLEAARKVAQVMPETNFVVAGTGDMLPRMIERSAELGLGNRVLFAGFVDRERADALYSMANVFVMPSVSEPFGLVPLEAMDYGVPVIVSRQSGVSELIKNVLKVDFWDVEDLAAKIVAALRYQPLASELGRGGKHEVGRLTWDAVAERFESLYSEVAHA